MLYSLWVIYILRVADISMQDRTVIYDNEKNMIGWGPGNCDRIPKGKASAS